MVRADRDRKDISQVGRTTLKVNLPSSGEQTTEWVYGVTTGGGNALNSKGLIKWSLLSRSLVGSQQLD